MSWQDRREALRHLLDGDECYYPVSVFDPMTARMAAEVGAEMTMLAGSVAAMMIAAAPDRILITATEFADLAHRICRASEVPLIVDADHGYGNALNAARTVSMLDHAGVAALTLEDTALPQPFATAEASLLPVEEGAAKMKAALAGRQDPKLLVIGRTSAIRISDRADAITRVQTYSEAGVDAIALIGVQTKDDLEALCAATDLPIMLGGLKAELRDRKHLAGLGVRICLTGHQPAMAAMQAAFTAVQAQQAGERMPPLASSDDIGRWTNSDAVELLAKRFLKPA
jgi:oxaloacetate decarboxylase